MSLDQHRKNWEELGEHDPLWAVLSKNELRHGKWNPEEFFATGREEIDGLMEKLAGLDLPQKREAALDFGCGVGRLSQALSKHFNHVTGVDISQPMLDKASELAPEGAAINFCLNTEPHLKQFENDSFDLIYSNITLQHVPSTDAIKAYIRDFVRMTKTGGLAVFQLPAAVNWKVKLNPRKRLYGILRPLGFSAETLLEKWNLSPIHMSAISKSGIEKLIDSAGGRLVKTEEGNDAGPNATSYWYFVTKA